MADSLSLLGLEMIVDDLDRSVALFVDLLGFELHDRRRSEIVAGDVAVVTDGRLAITLLQPTTAGDAPILADRTPRLSQFVLGADSGDIDRRIEPIVEAGLTVSPTANGFYVTPESVAGALGIDTAIVVTSEP